jgi:hypothetical protein
MKRVHLHLAGLLTVFILTASCNSKPEALPKLGTNPNLGPTPEEINRVPKLIADGKITEMTFESQTHDFGTIKQGDKVVHEFKFTNTGKQDLIIAYAKGSCGCTVPEYPKQAIKPGGKGSIKVSFNSAGKIGETSKTVTLTCNVTDGAKILYIKSNIVPSGTK